MKHRAKVLTSLTLAAAMVASALPVPVLAASDTSGIDIVSETEAPVIEIQDGETEGEIVITEPDTTESSTEDEIEVEAPKFGATLSLGSDDGIVMTPVTEGEETQAASSTGTVGDTKTLHVDAFNQETTDADLRLYFWDDEVEVPENPTDYAFANPADLIQLEGLTEESQVSIPVDTGEETVDVTADLVFEYAEDKETITATYLSMDLPADSEYAFDVKLSMEDPSVVTVVPEIVFEENVTPYAAWQLIWEEAEISVTPPMEDVVEKPSEDPIVIEKPEDGSDITIEEPEDDDIVVDEPSDDSVDMVPIEPAEDAEEDSSIDISDIEEPTDGSEGDVTDDTKSDVTNPDDSIDVDVPEEGDTDKVSEDVQGEEDIIDEDSDSGMTGIDEILNELPSDQLEDSVVDKDLEHSGLTDEQIAKEKEEQSELSDMGDFALDAGSDAMEEVPEQTESEFRTDPVMEAYILEHLDSSYVESVDFMTFATILPIKNTFFDGTKMDGDTTDITIEDALMYHDDAMYTQFQTMTTLYNLSDDSDYFVGYINAMMDTPNVNTTDVIFAMNDYDGQGLSNCIYDYDTGLAYIPKENFVGEDGLYQTAAVQAQMSQVFTTLGEDFGDAETVTSAAYTMDGVRSTSVSQTRSIDSILDLHATYMIESGLDPETMVVYVNGVPTDEDGYVYDATTGELTLNQSSCTVISVYVDGNPDEQAKAFQSSALLKSVKAASVTYDQMEAVGTVSWSDVENQVGQVFNVQVAVEYVEGSGGGQNNTYEGSYYLSSSHGTMDVHLKKLVDIINGSIGVPNWNDMYIRIGNVYTNYRFNLNQASGLPFEVVQMFRDYVGIHCAHIDTGLGRFGEDDSFTWIMSAARLRLLHYDASDGYIVMGINTPYSSTFEQAGSAMFKLNVEKADTSVSVNKVWNDSNNSMSLRPNDINVSLYKDGTKQETVQLNAANGWSYTWTGLDANSTYDVQEDSVPAHYSYSHGTMTGDAENGYSITLTNTLQSGKIHLTKSSSNPSITNGNDCYSLIGAEYTVYTNRSGNTLSGEVGKLTVNDKNGSTNTLTLPLDGNTGRLTVYVKETKAPTGYYPDDTIYGPYTITNGGTQEVRVTDRPMNDPVIIRIDKTPTGEVTGTMPSLAGTQFTLRYYDGYYNKNNLPSAPTRTWVIEVKETAPGSGVFVTTLGENWLVDSLSDDLYYQDGAMCLPLGTLTIQETKPAAGFTLNGYLKDKNGNTVATNGGVYVTQITSSNSGADLQGSNEFTSEDVPKPSNIIIKKYNGSNQPQSGTTYELRNSKGQVVGTATTGSNGIAEFRDLYPDTYTLTEIDTASGLTLLTKTITIKAPMTLTEREVIDNGIDKGKCVYDPVENCYYVFDQTYEITNDVTLKLPLTGATTTFATFLPLIGGTAVFAGSAAIFFKKKRK